MMMFNRPDGSAFVIDHMSLGLNVIAFVCLIASWQDGYQALILAMLIWIFDEIRHPNPIVMDLQEDEDEPPDATI